MSKKEKEMELVLSDEELEIIFYREKRKITITKKQAKTLYVLLNNFKDKNLI
jgi:hypothetical protein